MLTALPRRVAAGDTPRAWQAALKRLPWDGEFATEARAPGRGASIACLLKNLSPTHPGRNRASTTRHR